MTKQRSKYGNKMVGPGDSRDEDKVWYYRSMLRLVLGKTFLKMGCLNQNLLNEKVAAMYG